MGLVGGFRELRYRRTFMRTHRQRRATTVTVVLAVLLGSLWVGGLHAPATGDPGGRLDVTRPAAALEAAVLRDGAPALRPVTERPRPGGRLLLLLVGLVLAALAAGPVLAGRRPRSGPAPARSLAWPSHREARAPPFLQPA
jgi:hypothetical protein